MSNNSINVYYQQNFNLAKTLCIASKDSANAINNLLILQYGASSVDLNTPSTWKYYLNISGQYHSTDKKMTVVSLDTLLPIEFSIENLAINTATADGYQYGTRYYYSLLAEYPDQEQLILGILYPCSIDKAINSIDGTILSYPSSLIEPQEVTLISELESWVQNYLVRWNVRAFATSDDLYQVSYMAVMYLNILPKIINLRVKRCHTNEAHTFHISNFLASHYGLDIYMADMTLDQILFFYRNVRYIERNTGFKSTFTWIVNELLTKRNIPLAEYKVKLKSIFDKTYSPVLSFDRKSINTLNNIETKSQFTYSEFMSKFDSLAPDNTAVIANKYSDIESMLNRSASATITTKELESSLYDNTDAVPHKLSNVLFNEWIDLSSQGLYSAYIVFTDPTTAIEYSLQAQDAFLYSIYMFSKAIGFPLTKIPDILINKVRKTNLPKISDIVALSDSNYVEATVVMENILSYHPTDFTCPSVSSFFKLGVSTFLAGLQEWYQVGGEGDMRKRGQLWNMCDYLYCDKNIVFNSSGQSYSTWLLEKDIPDFNYTTDEYSALITSIYKSATGMSAVDQVTFSDIQTAMINILTTISSYSIQVLKEINSSGITKLGWGAIRASIDSSSVSDIVHLDYLGLVVSDKANVSNEHVFISGDINTLINTTGRVIDLSINKHSLNIEQIYSLTMLMGNTDKISTWQYYVENNNPTASYLDVYNALTTSQVNKLVDIWQSNLI